MNDKTKIWFPIARIAICIAVVAVVAVRYQHIYISATLWVLTALLSIIFVWSVLDLVIIGRRIKSNRQND